MTEPDQPGSPFTRRGFVAAGVVMALIVVAAVVVAVTSRGGGSGGGTAAQASTTTPARSASPSSSGCDQPTGSQVPPVAAPQTTWELVGKLVVPTDPRGAGPGKTTDGLRHCFAHDPTGALFAAVNWLGYTSDADQLSHALKSLTAPGPGRDALSRLLVANPGHVLGNGGYQVAGFTYLTYTGDIAMMNLALTASGGGRGSLPMTLQWSGGDWLLELPADGDIGSQISALDSLAGYVPWSGT